MTNVNTLITDHLDIWTTATEAKPSSGRGNSKKTGLYGIQKLRSLILELAVRGKLVPQDQNEGDGSGAVAKLARKREELVKQKLAKTAKNLDELHEGDFPFPIPHGWSWARLQDVSEYIQRGKGPKYADSGAVRVISQKCVQWNGFDLDKARFIREDSIEGYGQERFLRDGDVLWNSTGTGTVGRVVTLPLETDDRLVADSHVTVIRMLSDCPRFLEIYLSSSGIQNRIEPTHEDALVSGTTKQVELNVSTVLALPVPFPPMAEQHRIVAKVEELMTLCDALEAQTEDSLKAHQTLVETCLATLTNSQSPEELAENWSRVATHFDTLFTTKESVEQLKTAILGLAVQGKLTARGTEGRASPTEIVTQLKESQALEGIKQGKRGKRTGELTFETNIPENWQRIELQDLALQITDGTHLTPKYTDEGRPFLSAKNVKPFEFLPDNHRYVSEEDFEGYRQNRKPVAGDILMTRVGAGIGEAAVIDSDMEFAIYVSVCLIKPFTKYLMADFLCLWLNSPEGRALSTEKTYGRGASQGNLNLEFIRTFSIPLPPLPEQTEIVKNARALLEICDVLLLRIDHAQRVQASLADTLCSNIH